MMHNMRQDKSKKGKAENMVPRAKMSHKRRNNTPLGAKPPKKVTIIWKKYLFPRNKLTVCVVQPLRFVRRLVGVHERIHTPALEHSTGRCASACCRSSMSGNRHSRFRHQVANALNYSSRSSMAMRLESKTL